MPAMYESLKKKCLAEGKNEDECEAKAAKIYNAWAKAHGKPPLSEHVQKERGGRRRV